jgi:uncharacterized protein YqeY
MRAKDTVALEVLRAINWNFSSNSFRFKEEITADEIKLLQRLVNPQGQVLKFTEQNRMDLAEQNWRKLQ